MTILHKIFPKSHKFPNCLQLLVSIVSSSQGPNEDRDGYSSTVFLTVVLQRIIRSTAILRSRIFRQSRAGLYHCVKSLTTYYWYAFMTFYFNDSERNTCHSSRVLIGDGLVGGNPTINTSRLRSFRGGDSFFFKFSFTVLVLLYSIYILFCDSAFELERRALLPFWGFPASCFSEIIIFRNLIHIFFRKRWDFLWVCIFIFLFCALFWVSL